MMRRVIFALLVFVSLIILIIRFGSSPLSKILGLESRAGVRVEASQEAKVLIDQKEVGKTPFQSEDLAPGDHLISLQASSSNWQGYIKLNSGTLSVVNRDLAETAASSSGELITLEPGIGATIISTPTQADVEIDGKSYGQTPILIKDLAPGEHVFLISHNNFLKRSIRAVLAPGYNLNLIVDLAISETDFTKITSVPIQSSKQLVVKATPTGFLRVRAEPSLSSREIARVNPGDILTLLEEKDSWDKVKLSDGKEGYISASYVEKKQ